jgi:two-component system cell cycle response regulator
MPVAPARILLVEDNSSDRLFMNACIQDQGWKGVELQHAERLSDAGSHLKRQDFEMVITDLNLPDGVGLETFYKVKQMAPDSAIVVMSGMADPALASEALRAGAQDFLVKGDLPLERVGQSLVKALERHVRTRQLSSASHELKKKNESLRELAFVDPLTGLFNRRGLQKALGRRTAFKEQGIDSALLIDVDDFKRINDLFSYLDGDAALKEIGRRLRAVMRPGDIGARVGGDEFLLLAPNTPAADALRLAEQIRSSVAEARMPSASGSFQVTVSIGVEAFSGGSPSVEHLLDRSNQALRMSKGGGKNRVSGGAPSKEEDRRQGARAIVRRPFFDLKERRVAGYSFGVNAETPHHVPGPMEEGLVRDLLRSAANHGEGMECHLQLSHTQILHLHPEDLARACGRGLKARKLRLSIPEVPMSPLPPGLLESVKQLQAEGWALAIHDMGLGAHSWANLIQLEPAAVSLAPGLIRGCRQDDARLRALVRLYRALAALGAYVVAGGIESEEELKVLESLGVPYGWGPLLNR